MAALGRHARGQLAARLKELREATGLTQAEFAQRLGGRWGQPKVSRIEGGGKGQVPSADDLAEWAQAAGADLGELTAMLKRVHVEHTAFADLFGKAGGAGQHQDEIAAAEAGASRLALYYPLMVPGILQTASYAREMLSLDGGPATYGASEDDIGRMVASRQRRQAVLHEPGREVVILMSEAALRLRVASPATMRGQCEHIASLAASLPSAVIGVVPFAAQLPFAAIAAWEILDDIVLIEGEDRETVISDPLEVGRYWRYTRSLLGVSLTGQEAAALCRQIAGEHGA